MLLNLCSASARPVRKKRKMGNFRLERSGAVNFGVSRCCFKNRRRSSRSFHSTSRPPRATARDETREFAHEILDRGLSRTHTRARTRGRPASLRSREKSRAAHRWRFFAARQSRFRGLSPSVARTRGTHAHAHERVTWLTMARAHRCGASRKTRNSRGCRCVPSRSSALTRILFSSPVTALAAVVRWVPRAESAARDARVRRHLARR